MTTIADVFPLLGLRVRSGSLELRGISDDDIVALGALAQRGVHAPDLMPFTHPWTDAPVEEIPLGMAQYHWGERAGFGAARFSLDLGVWVDGELVGTQGLTATDYAVTRTGETGSWLGLAHHGRGIGTRMRQAICALAFDHLDAVEVTSAAYEDNPASLGVSRKVGYVDNGTTIVARRDQPARQQRFRLTPETFVRGEPIEVTGLAPLRRAIGLDAG